MFQDLSDKFLSIFDKLKGYGCLNEKNIEGTLREVRLALLEADVHVGVVRSFLENLKARSIGQEVTRSLHPDQVFAKLVQEELIKTLGEKPGEVRLTGHPPHIILLVGLQGSGKTTTAAKLAAFYKQQGRKPYLIPADTSRPAAMEQLKILGKNAAVAVYDADPTQDPQRIVKAGLQLAKADFFDLVIVDTAGRLHVNVEMMAEIRGLKENFSPHAVLFVADAMMGQESVKVAKAFHDAVQIDGLIMTKLDGDARGGAALSIQSVLERPIYFVGTGEKAEDFEIFDAPKLVRRLLDRGDLLSMAAKVQEVYDDDQAKVLAQKIKKNDFTIEDFRKQLQQIKKMGSMASIFSMLPGAAALKKKIDMNQAEAQFKIKAAIMGSMTLKERLEPRILNGSRRVRIAKGSGTQVADVNRLLGEFDRMKKMMQQFGKGGLGGLKSLFGSMG